MSKEFVCTFITPNDRVACRDLVSGYKGDDLSQMCVRMSVANMNVLLSRQNLIFSFIEYMVNEGEIEAAIKLLGSVGIFSAQMRRKSLHMLTDLTSVSNADLVKKIKLRITDGADLGMSANDIKEFFGYLE